MEVPARPKLVEYRVQADNFALGSSVPRPSRVSGHWSRKSELRASGPEKFECR
jgi:hypothetical protein